MKNILPHAVQHVYERAEDLGIIFYDRLDRLVYYTISATQSKKHGVVVIAGSIMFSHTHKSQLALTYQIMEQCENDIESSFARAYNHRYHRSGQLFDRKFGHSQKTKDKKIRQNIAYVFDNHVEKGLCKTAMDERWSFLAYAFSDHPFSEPIDRKHCSRKLSRFLGVVDRHIAKNNALTYATLEMMFKSLDEKEVEQLTDYIIYYYKLIDFNKTFSYFESPEAMVNVIRQFSGSEFDINEAYYKESDRAYPQMIALLRKRKCSPQRIFTMTEEEKLEYADLFHIYTDASDYQIKAFLHFNFEGK